MTHVTTRTAGTAPSSWCSPAASAIPATAAPWGTRGAVSGTILYCMAPTAAWRR